MSEDLLRRHVAKPTRAPARAKSHERSRTRARTRRSERPRRFSRAAAQPRERDDGLGGVPARVALVAAGARERLLHRVDRQHAERARHAGAQLDVLDAARGLGADPVVVVGLAADHRAEAGDAVVAARLGRELAPPAAARTRRGRRRRRPPPPRPRRTPPARRRPAARRGPRRSGRPRSRTSRPLAAAVAAAPRASCSCSARISSSSSVRPWWCSVWPIRSRLRAQVGLVVRVRAWARSGSARSPLSP